MRLRGIAILIAGAVAAFLLAGCQSARTYGEKDTTISAENGKEFVISLESNPSTGYHWEQAFDASALQLVAKKYKADPAMPGVMGKGGRDLYTFRSLKAGETKIRFGWFPPGVQPADTEKDLKLVYTVTTK